MLRCSYHQERGVDVATIAGRFTQDTGADTRNFLLFLVATGSGIMVLHLAETTYMDSYGLATLVLVQKAMKHRRGRVVLAEIPLPLQALIELTRIQSLFEIYSSQNVAINSLVAVAPSFADDASAPRPALSPAFGLMPTLSSDALQVA